MKNKLITIPVQVDDLSKPHRVCVYEHNKECSSTILFVHGNSTCSQVFRYQFEDETLSEKYRLIAFDLPGHGRSDPFHKKESYCLNGYINILESIISTLGITNPVLVGHSLGGHLCVEALFKLPKPKALVVFQTPPINSIETIDKAFTGQSLGIDYKGDLETAEIKHYANLLAVTDSEEIQSWVQSTDPNARFYLGQSVQNMDPYVYERI